MTDAAEVTTSQPGAEPAAAPTATTTEPEAKSPEQLAAEQQAADEAKKAEEEEKAEEERVKKKPWFQKRIDEQTRKYHDAERRAAKLEESLQRAVEAISRFQQPAAKPEEKPAPQPAFTPTRPAPTREQFEFDEDKYISAMVDWKFEQTEAKRAADARTAEMRRGQESFANEVETRRQATLTEGGKKYPDFDSVVSSIPATVMNAELALAVLETAQPADIAYHLGKNPSEAERISKLPPIKKAIELGKLEASLSAAAVKPTTKAPPPPSPVGGREPSTIDPDKLPMEEWYKLRQAGKI